MLLATAAGFILSVPKLMLAQTMETKTGRLKSFRFSVTNTTAAVKTVARVVTSCPCVAVGLDEGRVLDPGEILPFDVVFRPVSTKGGQREETVSVTLAPMGETQMFRVVAEANPRLAFDPPEAAFGTLRGNEADKEIVAVLTGYAAEGVRLESTKGGQAFDVWVAPDGRTLHTKFADPSPTPGVYSEILVVRTSDPEMPEIRFPASANIEKPIVSVPAILHVSADEREARKHVLVWKYDRGDFQILSVVPRPVPWGVTSVERGAGNTWRVSVERIDVDELRRVEGFQGLEIRTDVAGSETISVPVRVDGEEGEWR
jgi:hypothetical protein